MKKLKVRLFSIWKILTSKNFILVYDIKEYEKEGKKGRQFRTARRTDYTDLSDMATLYAAYLTIKEKYNL